MRTSVALALCLFGLTLAAEDNSTRKSRQILHPLVPLVHSGHSGYSLAPQHLLAPHVQYFQPAAHSAVLPEHALPHHYHHPQVFPVHYNPPHYQSAHYQRGPHDYHYPQSAGFPFRGRQNGVRPQAAPVTENSEQPNQYDGSNVSPRPYQQVQSGDSSFQPLITPSQDANEEQRFRSGSLLNQNFREQTEQQSAPDFSQSQASSGPSGLTAYRPSPRLYGPSQANVHYPSDVTNSQSAQNQQQNRAFFPGSFDQQSSSQQGSATPILSQSGQIRNDGSYNYGFQSANGIQSSESGEMRPGLHRYVQGSYSYTAPDGTPISAEYYADETGFHVRGDHIPSPVREVASSNFQQPSGQFQQLPSVQSN